MIIGTAGPRTGMTDAQAVTARKWLEENPPSEVHHGACCGTEAKLVLMAKSVYGRKVKAVAYPGHMPKYVSQPAMDVSDVRHPPAQTLRRNRTVVENVERMLVIVDGPERLQSGTWATVRWARKFGRPIAIVWPDGSLTQENQPSE